MRGKSAGVEPFLRPTFQVPMMRLVGSLLRLEEHPADDNQVPYRPFVPGEIFAYRFQRISIRVKLSSVVIPSSRVHR